MARTTFASGIALTSLALLPLHVSALDLQGFLNAASAVQGVLKGGKAVRPEKTQTLQGRQAEAQAREDEAAAARQANSPASSAQQASGATLPSADPTPVAAYRFKTAFGESLGTADLTEGLLPISADDKRLSSAARAALAGLLNSIKLFTGGTANDGLTRFNADRGLTDQERAQAIGIALAQLRSDARIRDVYGGTATDVQNRTAEGGWLVGLFVKSVPDAKNVRYVWMQPNDPAIRRPTIGSPQIRTPGRQMAGNLGDFLASAFQHKNPNTDISYYKLYDERMSPRVLASLDNQLASSEPSVWQKASSGSVTPSQDQTVLDGYTGNATNVGGHVTEPAFKPGDQTSNREKPRAIMDNKGKMICVTTEKTCPEASR